MKRAIIAFCLVFLFVFGLSVVSFADEGNLLLNGGFEAVSSSGMPENWHTNAYRSQAGYSRMTVTEEKAHTGLRSVVVENASSNDARFVYTVQVEPETLYRLSGYVLVESMQETGNGANFAVEDIYSFSEGLFDTNGEWEYLK